MTAPATNVDDAPLPQAVKSKKKKEEKPPKPPKWSLPEDRTCMCGCGGSVGKGSLWVQGHDARAAAWAKRLTGKIKVVDPDGKELDDKVVARNLKRMESTIDKYREKLGKEVHGSRHVLHCISDARKARPELF